MRPTAAGVALVLIGLLLAALLVKPAPPNQYELQILEKLINDRIDVLEARIEALERTP